MEAEFCITPGCPFGREEGTEYCKSCNYINKNEARLAEADEQKKEENNMGLCKEKTCVDCKNTFQPTSNRQERCLECAKKHKKAKNKENYSKRSPKEAVVKSPSTKNRAKPSKAQNDKLVDILMGEYIASCKKARTCRIALMTIEAVTGEDLDIPEFDITES